MLRNVLLISRYDTCRGPLAAAMLRQAIPQLSVASAGLDALPGSPACAVASRWAQAQALNLQMHRAQTVDITLCQRADLVLTMNWPEHTRLKSDFPSIQGHAFLLGNFRLLEMPFLEADAQEDLEPLANDLRNAVIDWVQCLRHVVQGSAPQWAPSRISSASAQAC